MREAPLGIASVLILSFLLSGCGSSGGESSSSPTGINTVPASHQGDVPVLTHLDTFQMEVGTHRPEIFVTEEGNLLLAVVEPKSDGNKTIKHQAYLFDPDFTELVKFDITWIDETYGEPADHRAAIINGQLVVVYQTLNYDPNANISGGPSEQYAKDQSLLLTRYTLEGEELLRTPIVANQTDFTIDNFPDHCLLWENERLLVSTGAMGSNPKLREIDLEGNIIETWTLSGDFSDIGNSLLVHEGEIALLSYLMGTEGGLTLSGFDTNFKSSLVGYFPSEERERTFPTGVAQINGYTFVAHCTAPAGTVGNPETNPFDAYLVVLDENMMEV
ncbi:MAG: hypothetical protein QF645_08155, partial [Planctomycetota bacterium]|nr:hypothetical protein [Planctomycetota bacterium]